jgi:hypothetical protein
MWVSLRERAMQALRKVIYKALKSCEAFARGENSLPAAFIFSRNKITGAHGCATVNAGAA